MAKTIQQLLEELSCLAVLPVEAAGMMEMEVDAVRNYCRTGRLSGAIKFGNEWLIPRASIELYMTNSRNKQGKKKQAAHGKETGS